MEFGQEDGTPDQRNRGMVLSEKGRRRVWKLELPRVRRLQPTGTNFKVLYHVKMHHALYATKTSKGYLYSYQVPKIELYFFIFTPNKASTTALE